MPEFMIEVPHAAEECFVAVSEALRHPDARRMLTATYWGCSGGTHTTWLVHEFEDAREAKALVPSLLKDTARVVQLTRLSMDEIHERIEEEGSRG